MPFIYSSIYSTTAKTALPASSYVKGNSFSVAANGGACFQVPYPNEGRLTAATLKQTGGTLVPFTAELLTSAGPYPGSAAGTVISYPATPACTVEMFRAIPGGLSGVAGQAVEFRDSLGGPFVNTDNTPTVRTYELYLVILPQGNGGITTWDFLLTSIRDVG